MVEIGVVADAIFSKDCTLTPSVRAPALHCPQDVLSAWYVNNEVLCVRLEGINFSAPEAPRLLFSRCNPNIPSSCNPFPIEMLRCRASNRMSAPLLSNIDPATFEVYSVCE